MIYDIAQMSVLVWKAKTNFGGQVSVNYLEGLNDLG